MLALNDLQISTTMDLLRMDIHRFPNEFIVIVSVNVVSIFRM